MPPKSRIRIYSPFFPFPVTEGGFQVAYDQARTLAEAGWEVELVSWKDSPQRIAEKLKAPSSVPFCKKILITHLSANGPRRQPASRWAEPGFVGYNPSEDERTPGRSARVARSIVSRWASPELFFYDPIVDFRHTLSPAEIGIYHYSFAYTWLAMNPSRFEDEVYVHFHDLESDLSELRAGNHRLRRLSPLVLIHEINAWKLRHHERRIGLYTTGNWFISTRDLDQYRPVAGHRQVRLVPPTFDPQLRELRRAAFRKRMQAAEEEVCLGFLGSCDFEPNRASLEWIVRQLAPELEKNSFSGRILVAGRSLPEDLREQAAGFGFFEWMGFVPDVEEFWSRLSFLLVPEIGGSGVRIKLIEALGSGVPVLANGSAVAPLTPNLRRNSLIAVSENPVEWAEWVEKEKRAFQTRAQHDSVDFPVSELDGRAVYRFLDR